MSGVMSEEERAALAQKLDQDLDVFIAEQVKKSEEKRAERARRGEPEEEEEDVETIANSLKNHPAFMTEFDPSMPMTPELEALQAMKYETESPDENATSYKEDGNDNFKRSKYRWAIDNYTAGINCKSENKELNAILHSNRAAAHYRIGNHRSALNDCIYARKFKPDHWKAIFKGIECCMGMKRYVDAMRWCDDALLLQPSSQQVLKLRTEASQLQKRLERDERKALSKERQKEAADEKLRTAILSRGVRVVGGLSEAQPGSSARVQLDDEGCLVWPVLLLYPEHAQSDFIEAFHEHTMFSSHLDAVFGGEPAPWDRTHDYTPDSVQVYFEGKDKETLVLVPKHVTLGQVLTDKRLVVQQATPGFIITVKDSGFEKDFVSKYKLSLYKTK